MKAITGEVNFRGYLACKLWAICQFYSPIIGIYSVNFSLTLTGGVWKMNSIINHGNHQLATTFSSWLSQKKEKKNI